MRFDQGQSRYSRYARASRAQRGRLIVYAVLLVVVVAVMFSLRSKGQSIAWAPSFEEAMTQAQADNRPILAYFYTADSEPCRRMEQTLADRAVRAEAKAFVCVRIDGPAHPELVKRYYVVAYPAVAFATPEGGRLRVVLDHRTPDEFLAEMREVLAVDMEQRAAPSQPPQPEGLTDSPGLQPRNAEPSRGEAE